MFQVVQSPRQCVDGHHIQLGTVSLDALSGGVSVAGSRKYILRELQIHRSVRITSLILNRYVNLTISLVLTIQRSCDARSSPTVLFGLDWKLIVGG